MIHKNIYSKLVAVVAIVGLLLPYAAPMAAYAQTADSEPVVQSPVFLDQLTDVPGVLVGTTTVPDLSRVDWSQEVVLDDETQTLSDQVVLDRLAIRSEIKDFVAKYHDDVEEVEGRWLTSSEKKEIQKDYYKRGLESVLASFLIEQGDLPANYNELKRTGALVTTDRTIDVSDPTLAKPFIGDVEVSVPQYKNGGGSSQASSGANNQATVNGQAIAALGSLPKERRRGSGFDGYIEVVDFNPIQNGVEVFARAWEKNGKQIGFGNDGSVDIERFVVINPPLLVPDENGEVVRIWVDDTTEELVEARYTKNLQEVVFQVLEHNLSVLKNRHDAKNIAPGKRGNTTTTVFPTHDGRILYQNAFTWDQARTASAGTHIYPSDIAAISASVHHAGSVDYDFYRSLYTFDTSSIPTTDEVSAATLSLYVTSTSNGDPDGNDFIGVVEGTPSNPLSYTVDDYDQVGTINNPVLGAPTIDIDNFIVGSYNTFTLDSNGRSWVDKSGYTVLGLRAGHDINNHPMIETPTRTNIVSSYSEEVGTTQDPKLVVEHTASGGGSTNGNFHVLVVGGGGGGGNSGGGGGAGGYQEDTLLSLEEGLYPITVGFGGIASGPSDTSAGGNGGNSSIGTELISFGGGGGSARFANGPGNGGSGGGGAQFGLVGGLGVAGQGNNGGDGVSTHGGGGGGAGAVGFDGDAGGGDGGAGNTSTISGLPVTYAGGGGGGYAFGGSMHSSGGIGGGGDSDDSGEDGTDGLGGGGGASGTSGFVSGAGGDGIVIIRFETGSISVIDQTNAIETFVGGDTVLTWETSGTFEFTTQLNPIPHITLLGDNPLYLAQGSIFTEPGYSAIDAEDGDITANVIVGGDTVNTNVAGTYTITYNVTDSSGNPAVEESRSVVVTGANSQAVDSAKAYLLANQNADGSWGSGSTQFVTTVAVLDALYDAGETGTTAYTDGVDWVNFYITDNNDYFAQQIDTLTKSGADVTQLTEALAFTLNNTDGGFVFDRGYESDALTTAQALQALTAAGYQDPGSNPTLTVSLALYYLTQTQRFDDGWSVFDKGASSVEVTSEVLAALLPYETSVLTGIESGDIVLQGYVDGASTMLKNLQQQNGTWNNSLLKTALAFKQLKDAGAILNYTDATVAYLESAQAGDGSYNNGDAYTTAKVLQALLTGGQTASEPIADLVVNDITPVGTTQTGSPLSLDISITNNGNFTVSNGALHILADKAIVRTIGFSQAGISLAPGEATTITVPMDNTWIFVGDVEFTVFVEGATSPQPNSWYDETITFTPDTSGLPGLPVYFVANKVGSIGNDAALNVRWQHKADPNRLNYMIWYRELGQPTWNSVPIDSSWETAFLTFPGVFEGTVYEITFGAVAQDGSSYVQFSDPVEVKVSYGTALYLGTIQGAVSIAGEPLGLVPTLNYSAGTNPDPLMNTQLLYNSGGNSGASADNGSFSFADAKYGSGVVKVDHPLYEQYVHTYVSAEDVQSVNAYTRQVSDAVSPTVSSLYLLGRESTLQAWNKQNETIVVVGYDDSESWEKVTFSYYDPNDLQWHEIGSKDGLLDMGDITDPKGTSYQWHIPETLSGSGYKLKAVATDYSGNTSTAVEWGPFQILEGSYPPKLSLLAPSLTSSNDADASYTIKWTDEDDEENAQITLLYDVDNDYTNGNNVFIANVFEDDFLDQYEWDTSQVAEGSYYIHASIDDGWNNPVWVTSVAPITITHTPVGNQQPAISLLGDDPMYITLGGSFAEPGYTATDAEDGDITASVVIGGDTVDTNTTGTYTITYDVTDSGGLAATQVSRDVVVSSSVNTPPTLSLLGNNPLNLIEGDTFAEPGYTATDLEDGDITASVVVGGDTVNTSIPNTYTITYNVSDSEGYAATEQTRDVVVVANAAPVITLLGDNPVELIVGDTYTEPGYTATDAEDGDVTANVVIGGDTVDANTVGSYVVTYDVTDSNGKSATQVTRTVNVSPPPTQCNDGIDNDGDGNIDLADTGCVDSADDDENDAPVITLIGNSPLNIALGDTYTEPGYSAADIEDGDITGSVAIGGDVVNTNVEGTYTITYDVTDSGGLAATQVTRDVVVINTHVDTGLKAAGSVLVNTGWTNMTVASVASNDSSRAECDKFCDNNDDSQLGNFSFNIPQGSVVEGIEVVTQMSEDKTQGGATQASVSLSWNNGSSFTSPKTVTVIGTSDNTYSFGNSTDLWGRTWNVSDLADGTFRLRLDKETVAKTLLVDQIQVRVYYNAPLN